QQRILGAEHPEPLASQHNLARVLGDQGKLNEAETMLRRGLEIELRLFGSENPSPLITQNSLSKVLGDQGKIDEALRLCRQTLRSQQQLLGPENPSTLKTQKNLASLLADHHGDSTEAEKLFREVLASERKTSGTGKLGLAATLAGLGSLLIDNGRAGEAESLLRECLEIREKHLPADHWHRSSARSLLGGALAKHGKFAEAEPLLLDGYEGLSRAKYVPPKQVSRAIYRLVELYEKWGKPGRAAEWKAKLALMDLPNDVFAGP
ncbi:MAG TPA: tetratricopeptide repeat protein, partial [Isosphaeraceae bacterium]|nr:tetratricopeptide repeat protein [Isosphaeraceae bacterium]